MPDWVPIQHQLDTLRMDAQFVLRQIIEKADQGKIYRARKGDYLPMVLVDHGLAETELYQVEGDERWHKPFPGDMGYPVRPTKFGRRIIDNDHALREVAMDYMNYLTPEQLKSLQDSIPEWPWRDPQVVALWAELRNDSYPPGHEDFFPQAPWYFHTIGRLRTPKKLRDEVVEYEYIHGGYTGKDFSAAEMLEDPNAQD